MRVQSFFDPRTNTITYLVWDEATSKAAIIDPVLDYDAIAARVSNESADAVLDFVARAGLDVEWILETHAHADHLSASQYLKERTGAPVAIGANIRAVQAVFKDALNLGEDFPVDGSQFDRLLVEGDTIALGGLEIRVLETPGHTPACVSYTVGDAVFTGDAMFMPDFGTGRCDFPGGSAETLYESVTQKLYALPDETRVFVGHDYGTGGREIAWETTIGAAKAQNVQLQADTEREQFVTWRANRDAGLKLPRLIFQSIQVNVDAGHLPPPSDNGKRYLKIPLNLFG